MEQKGTSLSTRWRYSYFCRIICRIELTVPILIKHKLQLSIYLYNCKYIAFTNIRISYIQSVRYYQFRRTARQGLLETSNQHNTKTAEDFVEEAALAKVLEGPVRKRRAASNRREVLCSEVCRRMMALCKSKCNRYPTVIIRSCRAQCELKRENTCYPTCLATLASWPDCWRTDKEKSFKCYYIKKFKGPILAIHHYLDTL